MSPPPESVDDTAREKKINLGFVRVGGGCVKIPERRGGHIPGVTRHAVQIQPCLSGSPYVSQLCTARSPSADITQLCVLYFEIHYLRIITHI